MDRAVAGLTAVMCAVAIVAASFGPFWRIREVAIEGAHHVTVDAVVTASELVGAQSFTASAARARARLVKLPAVRDARVEIRIPDHARVVLSERVAIARWVSGGTELFVDAEGVLFSSLDPRAAPEIRVTDEQKTRQAGDRLDPALVDAATKLARLGPGELRSDATSPRVVLAAGATGLVLRVAAGWEIRFGGAERIDDKIALARRFLRDNQQRKLDYVDVRSPDQIVFSPS
ncbi:MAG: FtsQ-type POTRA domain-containing protein [Chloroflexota bacterium]|nr:FtsQ-type POTRA domain-containing protein [Chloroflexota bacterium]